MYVLFNFIQISLALLLGNTIMMVESTKVLRPLFHEIEILIPGDSPSIFPSLDKMRNFNSLHKQY